MAELSGSVLSLINPELWCHTHACSYPCQRRWAPRNLSAALWHRTWQCLQFAACCLPPPGSAVWSLATCASCSLNVIQQPNQTKKKKKKSSVPNHLLSLILEAPAICNKHQLKLWPDLSALALWWHRLPSGFIKAFHFAPAIFWCRFYLWHARACQVTQMLEREH